MTYRRILTAALVALITVMATALVLFSLGVWSWAPAGITLIAAAVVWGLRVEERLDRIEERFGGDVS